MIWDQFVLDVSHALRQLSIGVTAVVQFFLGLFLLTALTAFSYWITGRYDEY